MIHQLGWNESTLLLSPDNETTIFISRYSVPQFTQGWDLTRGYAWLEVEQLPALPFLCQSTIDDMDQDADLIDFGRYA